jgi:DNA polymerase III alpha subunit
MNRRLFGILCLVHLILVLSSHDAFTDSSEVSIEKILSAKESYDGKEVIVSGKVSHLESKTSKAGNDYTTFTLSGSAGKGSLNVYSRGHTEVKQGQTVKVTGIYRKEKRVGRYTFRNEIEATDFRKE